MRFALGFALALSLFSLSSHASEPIEANIYKGNIAVSGGFGLGYSTYSKAVVALYPGAEYFFADRFSVGGIVNYQIDSSETIYSLGPAATYYFWAHKKFTSLFQVSLIYQHLHFDDNSTHSLRIDPALGFLYFPVRYVSFGPVLTVDTPLDKNSRDADSTPNFRVVGQFSVFF